MTKRVFLVGVGLGLCGSLLGCTKTKQKERGTMEFYMKGARLAVKRLEFEAMKEPEKRDNYGMQAAVMNMEDVLEGLPNNLKKRAKSRIEERTAAAEEALKFFRDDVRPLLLPLNYDEGEARQKIDKLSGMLDEAPRP